MAGSRTTTRQRWGVTKPGWTTQQGPQDAPQMTPVGGKGTQWGRWPQDHPGTGPPTGTGRGAVVGNVQNKETETDAQQTGAIRGTGTLTIQGRIIGFVVSGVIVCCGTIYRLRVTTLVGKVVVPS